MVLVCFDVGGTVAINEAGAITEQLASVHQISLAEARAVVAPAKVRRESLTALATRICHERGRADLLERTVDVLHRAREELSQPILDPAATGVSRTLVEQGHQVAYLSNVIGACAAPAGDLLKGLLGPVFLSCDLGVAKPDRRAFEAVAAELCAEMSDTVFVGDALDTDVLGALSAGAHAVHLDRQSRYGERSRERYWTVQDLRGVVAVTTYLATQHSGSGVGDAR